MSYGGRLVLINSVLNSLPMFVMSFFEILKSVFKQTRLLSVIFWHGNNDKQKYRRLAKRDILCRPKEQGGLGITNLFD
jgi:hypothetical protein